MKVSAILAGGILPVALAAPSSKYVLREERGPLESHWAKGDAAHDATVIPARIALKQSNVEKGEALIADISNPDSPKYGKHLSPQEVADLFAPSDETVNSVKQWLVASGVPESSIRTSANKGWLQFDSTAGKLGELLRTKYHQFTDKKTSRTYLGADSYSLPSDIAPHVDFVTPATAFTQVGRAKRRVAGNRRKPRDGDHRLVPDPSSLSTCDQTITPNCIRALYGIPKPTSAHPGNDLGLFEAQDDEWNQDDLNKFLSDMRVDTPKGYGPATISVNNGTAPSGPGEAGPESMLDLEIVVPLIYPQNTTVYQYDPKDPPEGHNWNEVFTFFLDSLKGPFCKDDGAESSGKDCNKYKIPNVLSVSWGDVEDPGLASFHKRQCTEWMKLGLAGTTVIFASGDTGAQSREDCWGDGKDMFTPDGPSSCPYITAVGATYLPEHSKIGDPEHASNQFASGGGFSNIFPTPDWQAKAVSNYLKNASLPFKSYNTSDGILPHGSGKDVGIYNRGGRGYPDIAANGENAYTITNGDVDLAAGTSMSAPLFASMINLINEDRLAAGKSVVGYINPSLYKMYENGNTFNDITIGGMTPKNNCGTDGFQCTEGWDPVTGLGTPKYGPMHDFFLSLQ